MKESGNVIAIDTEKELLARTIETFGAVHQLRKAIEELSELITAIARQDTDNIAEEIADVRIMCKQLEMIFKVDAEPYRVEKLERLARML